MMGTLASSASEYVYKHSTVNSKLGVSGGVIVVVLIGFLVPMTVGTFLMGVTIASPVTAILGFITGHSSSGINALIIGVLAFAGQFIIGRVRRDRVEYQGDFQ